MGLPFEFRLEPFGARRVALRPDRPVILDLFLDHRVEDDRDLVGRGGSGCGGAEFAFHPPQIIPQRRLVVM